MQLPSVRPTRVIRISGERRGALERARERLFRLMIVASALFLAVTFRLFQLTVIEANDSASPIQTLAQITSPPRAEILDRNGVVLAKSMPSRSLIVRPHDVLDAEEATQQVLQVIPDLKYEYVKARMQPTSPMRYLKRHISKRQEGYLRAYGDPGLQFQNEYRRIYPGGALAAHVVGFSDADGYGRLGVEAYFNQRLQNKQTRHEPLRLSLDTRVQHALEDELLKGISLYRAEAGIGVVLSIKTGEVLAMASLPDFDPNDVMASPTGYQANRATDRTYELGSTFKSFTIAQSLELGMVTPETVCDAAEPLQLGNKLIHDRWALRKPLTITQVLVRSSNTCSGRLGAKIGADRQRAFLSSLGLLAPLRLELGETTDYRMSSRWGMIASATIAYGHGIAITPMHLAQGAATLLNDGRRVEATLLRQNPTMVDGALNTNKAAISVKTGKSLRQMLRLAVVQGTGQAADVPGLRVGGKTGTAERVRTDALGYDKDKNVNTFLGAFPMDAPEYVVVVILDSPQALEGTHLRGAGANTAQVAGSFIRRAASFLNVYPEFREETWLSAPMVQTANYSPPAGWDVQ